MFKIKEKIERSLSKRGSENSFLRLLRLNTSFQPSIIGMERADHEDAYDYSQREIRNVMLEAEYAKALGIMERQRYQCI